MKKTGEKEKGGNGEKGKRGNDVKKLQSCQRSALS